MTLTPGEYVRLIPREAPFVDSPKWWWRVVTATADWFDATHASPPARRRGVGYDRVLEVRRVE